MAIVLSKQKRIQDGSHDIERGKTVDLVFLAYPICMEVNYGFKVVIVY